MEDYTQCPNELAYQKILKNLKTLYESHYEETKNGFFSIKVLDRHQKILDPKYIRYIFTDIEIYFQNKNLITVYNNKGHELSMDSIINNITFHINKDEFKNYFRLQGQYMSIPLKKYTIAKKIIKTITHKLTMSHMDILKPMLATPSTIYVSKGYTLTDDGIMKDDTKKYIRSYRCDGYKLKLSDAKTPIAKFFNIDNDAISSYTVSSIIVHNVDHVEYYNTAIDKLRSVITDNVKYADGVKIIKYKGQYYSPISYIKECWEHISSNFIDASTDKEIGYGTFLNDINIFTTEECRITINGVRTICTKLELSCGNTSLCNSRAKRVIKSKINRSK